jgi:mono/diheme cytochrome c family protein
MFKPITWAVLSQLLCACAAMAVEPAGSRPEKTNEATIGAGARRFDQSCAYCHGSAGAGGPAPALRGRGDLASEYVEQTIANGRQRGSLNMPAWKGAFTDAQIQELTAYILSLKNAAPAK